MSCFHIWDRFPFFQKRELPFRKRELVFAKRDSFFRKGDHFLARTDLLFAWTDLLFTRTDLLFALGELLFTACLPGESSPSAISPQRFASWFEAGVGYLMRRGCCATFRTRTDFLRTNAALRRVAHSRRPQQRRVRRGALAEVHAVRPPPGTSSRRIDNRPSWRSLKQQRRGQCGNHFKSQQSF